MSDAMGADLERSVTQLVGASIAGWLPCEDGLTHALTGIVTLSDGRTAFVKTATDEQSEAEMKAEVNVLRHVEGWFMPRIVAVEPAPHRVLVLEDLSAATWPEPYPADLSLLQRALADLRAIDATGLGLIELRGPGPTLCRAVSANATVAVPDLAPWVAAHAEQIAAAAHRAPAGTALVHGDLWYSNLCFLDDRVVLVDWSYAKIGSPWFDTSTVNIDLVLEGRQPLPMEEAAEWAAAHLVWSIWSLAEGPGPSISNRRRWRSDVTELVDGAAWWLADLLGLDAPPTVSDRTPGYR